MQRRSRAISSCLGDLRSAYGDPVLPPVLPRSCLRHPRERYPALAAGILPCFWIYEDVGRRLKDRVGDLTGHPYADWISTYGDPAFAASTEQAKQILDRTAAQADPGTVERMHEAFATASRYEWMFWDASWRQETWPV